MGYIFFHFVFLCKDGTVLLFLNQCDKMSWVTSKVVQLFYLKRVMDYITNYNFVT